MGQKDGQWPIQGDAAESRRTDLDSALPALWPDPLACAEMRKSSVAVWLLLYAEKLLLLLMALSCFFSLLLFDFLNSMVSFLFV